MKKVAQISKETYWKKVEINLSDRQKIVLAVIKQLEQATSKEVSMYLGVPLNTISGRFSELEDLGEIEKTGERRGGCNIYRPNKTYSVDKDGQVTMFQ